MNDQEIDSFGGCQKLRSQYRCIGYALLDIEKILSNSPFKALSINKDFREQVAFIPLEVLESYLDDLLGQDVDDQKLYIRKDSDFYPMALVSVIGLLFSIGVGLITHLLGAKMIFSFSFVLISSAPFVLLYKYLPTDNNSRKVIFARILSHEIKGRKGGSVSEKETGIRKIIQKSKAIEGVAKVATK